MSNIGQAALIVVGTVVGAYFGNPELGFALGSLAGSALFPTQLPAGPKLTDNRTTTASVGEPVPIIFGTCTVSGTVIGLGAAVQHSSEQGGKGGPQQLQYTYTQTIAIGLCERINDSLPDATGAIGGVTRIWENGTLVYDIRPQQLADTQEGLPAPETDDQYQNRLNASAAYAETFTLYLGDELQTADATLEGIYGAGNVPAFRSLAYIVYPDRQLQTSQGWRHPSFTFEVYQAGTGDCMLTNQASNEVLYPWAAGDGTMDPSNPLNTNIYSIIAFDDAVPPSLPAYGNPGSYSPNWASTTYTALADAAQQLETFYGVPLSVIGYGQFNAGGPVDPPLISRTGAALLSGLESVAPDGNFVLVQLAYTGMGAITLFYDIHSRPGTFGDAGFTGKVVWADDPSFGTVYWMLGPNWTNNSGAGVTPDTYPGPSFPAPWTGATDWESSDSEPGDLHGIWGLSLSGAAVQIERRPSAPLNPCADLPPVPGLPGYCLAMDGSYIQATDWFRDTSRTYKVLQQFTGGGSGADGVTWYPLNPCLPTTDPNYSNEAFWTTAYNAAVAKGYMPAGLTYSANGLGSSGPGGTYPVAQNWGYTLDLNVCVGAGGQATIASIILSICERCGLDRSQVDVSDMGAVTIPGYSVSNVCDGADIISPLRSVSFFDCVESGPVLRFPARGKPIVATLTTDQIGCYDGGTAGDTVPPSMSVARADPTTLPRSIRLHYKGVSRDYQDAEQDSPFRLATLAVNDQDVSIPICLGDTQALQSAEIIWADAWSGQTAYEASIDQSLLAIEVGDCVAIPVDGFTQRARIISDSNSGGVLRKLSMVSDTEGAYVSVAIASPVGNPPPQLKFLSPTLIEFLDLPALQDSDNDAGFYLTAQPDPTSGNLWNGCQIYKSTDGGATFTTAAAISTASAYGTLQSSVPASEPFDYDDVTEIIVNCGAGVSFESRTDDALLTGANAAAMGAAGRWEILQFGIATKLSSTQWKLTHLLRGRRGTEHLLGSSVAGDTFVLVSSGGVARIVLANSEIGASRIYKVVTVGAAYATGVDYPFVGKGQALLPFSPVMLSAKQDTAGDWELSWIRRGRLGQELPSGTDIPLSEAEELYSIDIYKNNSFGAVVRTLSSTMQGVTYSVAEQTADGTHGAAGVFFAVYQISEVVGRGTPAFYPTASGGGGGTITPPPIGGDTGRSSSTAYLDYIKHGYGDDSDPALEGFTLEWRFRFPTSGYIVDLQSSQSQIGGVFQPTTNSFRTGVNGAALYEDGAGIYSSRVNLNCLTDAVSDGLRYIYAMRAFQGNDETLVGAGLLQKIDTNGGVLTVVGSVSIGVQGDAVPEMAYVAGSIYCYCPYDLAVIKVNAATMSITQTYAMGSGLTIPQTQQFCAGESGSLWAQRTTAADAAANRSEFVSLDPITLATLSNFVLTSGSESSSPWTGSYFEGVIVGNYLYALFYYPGTDRIAELRKFNLITGAQQAFTKSLPSEQFESLSNYLTLDGTLLSVGRTIVYVIDTTTDTVIS